MKKKTELKVEYLSTAKLIPYARNAKLHSPEQVSAVAASIKEFGFVNPVLVDVADGIIAGHCRVMAAQKLALETVPCIRLAHLSDVQRRAYILADNRLSEIGGGWDFETLKVELEELKLEDIDVALTGWDDAALAALSDAFQGEPQGGDDEQGEEEKANTVVVIGQYRMEIPRKKYMDWLEEIRQAVGFDDPAIEKEILRRLKL